MTYVHVINCWKLRIYLFHSTLQYVVYMYIRMKCCISFIMIYNYSTYYYINKTAEIANVTYNSHIFYLPTCEKMKMNITGKYSFLHHCLCRDAVNLPTYIYVYIHIAYRINFYWRTCAHIILYMCKCIYVC